METINRYENYPKGTVILSNLLSILIYTIGFLIILKLSLFFSILYLFYIFLLEFRLLKYHCTNCYYWGKTCGFGKGKISSAFFKKGDISKFCSNKMTWKDMIPDILVLAIPLVSGIVQLILEFDFVVLILIILILTLSTSGNSFIRGKLTCKNCKQVEIGCPAYELFNQNKKD
jgi:hypothetical protein